MGSMPDLSFAPLLAEHRLTWWAVYPWNGGFEVAPRCTCGVLWAAGDREDPLAQIARYEAHLEAVLRAEVARWLGSDEAVEVAAPVLDIAIRPDEYVHEFQERQARAALAALTTHLTGDTR